MRVTITPGNPIPVVVKAGYSATIITASGTAGTVSVPGEGVADSLSASATATYGVYAADREVIIRLTAGSATVQVAPGSAVSGAGVSGQQIVNGGTAGSDSGWVPYTPGMRLAYALDSGSTATAFSVDISADGTTALGQAFTGTWGSTTAEISPPIWLTNPAARYIRFNVLGAGPLSVIRF